MITKNLAEELFWTPLQGDVDKLIILNGYATPSAITWLIENIQNRVTHQISLYLTLGMVAYDGISKSAHDAFVELTNQVNEQQYAPKISRLECSYIYKNPIHGALYIWLKKQNPVTAFMGSANFTQSVFVQNIRREFMQSISAEEAYEYYTSTIDDSVICTYDEIEEEIKITGTKSLFDNENNLISDLEAQNKDKIILSLLKSKKKEMGSRSSLNWGQRGNRNRNEAYIPIHQNNRTKNFFPVGSHFCVITDDKKSLILRVEQDNNKAITTPYNNALLGEYFRNRLGLANGAFVSLSDLERYGRTDVTFYKIDDEQYYMDFSSPNTR